MTEELQRICGVDLTSIDGIHVMTAFTVIAEVGTDMSRFADENHFALWMGFDPEQRHYRRKSDWTGEKEGEEPRGRGVAHGGSLQTKAKAKWRVLVPLAEAR